MAASTDALSVLYIGGEGRSGSTTLATMLGNQRGYFPVGELRGIWQAVRLGELCGCGETFWRCQFWSEVGRTAFGGWERIDLSKVFQEDAAFARHRGVPRQFLAPRRLKSYQGVLAPLYAAIAEISGCRVIVDSTKDPSYAFLLRGVPNVDVRVVHLVRDSRGVAFSWSKPSVERPEYAQHDTLRDTYMSTRRPWKSAVEWTGKNLLLHTMRGVPRVLVRYEDLMEHPDDEVARIRGLVGDTQCVSGSLREFDSLPFHTLGGNRVRFTCGKTRVALDLEWRSKMALSQRRIVEGLTLPLLVAYRYGFRSADSHQDAAQR